MADNWKEGVEHDQRYHQSKQNLVAALTGLEEALEAGNKLQVAEWEEKVAAAEDEIAETSKQRTKVAKGQWEGETAAVLSGWIVGEWSGMWGLTTDENLNALVKQCSLICKHMNVRAVMMIVGKFLLQHVRAATKPLLDSAVTSIIHAQNEVRKMKYVRIIHNGASLSGTKPHTHPHPFGYSKVDVQSVEGRMLSLLLDRFIQTEPYVDRVMASAVAATSSPPKPSMEMQAVVAVGIVNIHHLHHCVSAEQIRDLVGVMMSLCREVVLRHGGRIMGFHGLAGLFVFPGDAPLSVLSCVLEIQERAAVIRNDPTTVADKNVRMCLCLAQAVHLAQVAVCSIGSPTELRQCTVGRGVEFAQSLLHLAATETLPQALLLSKTFVTRARGDTVTALKYTFWEYPSEFRVAGYPQVVFALGDGLVKKFDPTVSDIHSRFMAYVRTAKKLRKAGNLIRSFAARKKKPEQNAEAEQPAETK